MAWIESHDTLANHPKVRRLARKLGISKAAAIGQLHLVWWWALNYTDDGDISRFDAIEIADGSQWDGDPEMLIEALIDSGFLDRDGDQIVIHDWWVYAGRYIALRDKNETAKQKAAERQKRYREKQKSLRDDPVTHNANVTETLRNDVTKRRVTVAPDQTRPNQTKESANALSKRTRDSLNDDRRQELAGWFREFFDSYPRPIGEVGASTEWFKLSPDAVLREQIMLALEAWKKSDQWREDGGRFIPAPAKWIADQWWRNAPDPAPIRANGRVLIGEGRLAL
jgi:hypothetical protein